MKKIIIAAIIVALVLIPLAYYLISPLWRVVEVQEQSPLLQTKGLKDQEMKNGVALLAQGEFMASAHEVKGKGLLIQDGNSLILRFEDFETVNGPDLHIWLASSIEGEDYIDVGPIKATKGEVNYDIPAGTDTKKYNKVLVWCVPFKVLFSYAELK